MHAARALAAVLLAAFVTSVSAPRVTAGTAERPQDDLSALVSEIIPDDGPVSPPYELARQDMGLKPDPDLKIRTEELLRHAAVLRQERMERAWTPLKERADQWRDTAERRAAFALLSYAFGEGSLEDAAAASREAGAPARLRLARLLLAECRCDEAVRELTELAGGKDGTATLALGLLARHAEERAALAHEVTLVPLATDLEAYLKKRAEDPATAALIEGYRKATRVRMPSDSLPRNEPEREILSDTDEILDTDKPVIFNRPFRLNSLDTAFLQTFTRDLELRLKGNSLVAGESATLALRSAFGGPMTFRLYRFTDADPWRKADAAALAALQPERTWAHEFRPLRQNNREKLLEAVVPVDRLDEGYYLLTAEARYAPVLAAQKFCVSRVALYVRAARNRVVVAAVDRRDGHLLPDVPVALDILGTPQFVHIESRIASGAKPGDPPAGAGDVVTAARLWLDRHDPRYAELREAFQCGFLGTPIPQRKMDDKPTPDPAAEDASPAKDAAVAQAYAAGLTLRQRYPDVTIRKEARTGPDGSVDFPVDIGRPDYAYTVSAHRTGPGLAEAEVAYSEPDAKDRIKAVAWTAQPLYRPGSTVQFKGIVRRFDGIRVADHDPAWKATVRVAVKNDEATLWEGERPLSAAGTFHGEFAIPPGAPLGGYRVHVDGESASPHAPLWIEEFRLPTFRVDVRMDRYNYRGGEIATGHVAVRYVHGEPAVDAQVEVVLETGELDPPTRLVTTDAQGQARFEIPLPQVRSILRPTLRASAMDASGETYTGTGHLTIQANPFKVDVNVAPSPAIQDSDVELSASVTRWDGTPVAGAAVVVEGTTRAVLTDAKGLAQIPLRTAKDGTNQTFKVTVVSGTDAVQASESIALRPRTPEPPPEKPGKPAHRDLLWMGHDEYHVKAGDPLKITWDMDHADGKACGMLIFVENTRMLDCRVMSLPPGKHEVAIPTKADWAPSARVTLVAFTGRTLLSDHREFLITPVDRFLTLTVETDRAEYRPGDRCRADVRAVDSAGRPAAGAEISLGVTHLGLHVLRGDATPDLMDFFHAYYLPALPTGRYDGLAPDCQPLLFWKGPKYAWGCYAFDSLISRGGGYGGRFGGRSNLVARGGGATSTIPLRSLFRTQAHWVADLVTDADGRARTEFIFPDDITEWVFTARGVTPDTRVGDVVVRHRTVLPLQVEVSLPRALRVGDTVTARAVVHNNEGDGRAVTVTAAGTGKAEGELRLEPKHAGALGFPLAPRELREHTIAASVRDRATGEGDRLERKILVLQRGHPVAQTHAGSVKDGGRFALDGSTDAVPGSRGLAVSLEAGLAGPIVSALDRLIDYPYGCVEQTMSRFMPAVIAARAMREARIDHPRAAELDVIFDQGLRRLAGFQHADGGWGWWSNDATNDFMTAYVLEGLALCRDAGRLVPAGMIERSERYLAEKAVRGGLEGRAVGSIGEVDLRIWSVHALAVAYGAEAARFEAQRKRLVEVLPPPDAKRPVRDAALLADARRRLGREQEARADLDAIADRFRPDTSRRSLFTAATLLELGAALEPGGARWTGLAHQLVARRRGPSWCDTLATAAAVRGLSAVLSGHADEAGAVEVLVDGRSVRTIEPRTNGRVSETIPLGDAARQVEIRPAGARTGGFWSARVEAFLEKPPAPPADPAARLACRVYRTQPERAELAPDAGGTLRVRQGETLDVELECELLRPLACLRVSLPRPCGVEMTAPPPLRGGLVAFEVHDDGLHFFADGWDAGRHTVRFRVRAEAEGLVFAPLPVLEPMYGDPVPVAVTGPVAWSVEKGEKAEK